MAEFCLKVKRDEIPEPAYQDGDIIVAVNDRRIKDVHAQHICNRKLAGFNKDGLRPSGSLPEVYLSKIYTFKFERVSKTEIRRTNLLTLEEDILSGTPNQKGEQIDVELFITRRKKHHNHAIFGKPGEEYWFGGYQDNSDTKLDEVWQEIEARTAFRKVNHTKWPFTPHELRQFLVLPVNNFTIEEETELTASVIDREGNILKKRKNSINWRDLLGKTPLENDPTLEKILDKNISVDIRGKGLFERSTVVRVKT